MVIAIYVEEKDIGSRIAQKDMVEVNKFKNSQQYKYHFFLN